VELESILLGKSHATLAALNLEILRFLMRSLGIETPIVKASDYVFQGAKSERVLDMCRQLKADVYIFGAQGRDYANVNQFLAAGVKPCFQEYRHPTYRQLHGEFLPYMSVIDLLFNEGPRSRDILLSGNDGQAEFRAQSVPIAREA
jgi:hypothetical protein